MMEKYACADNSSRTFPFVDIIPDEEVRRSVEAEIKKRYPIYRIIEWDAHDEPMGFGKRIITCKFEVEVN